METIESLGEGWSMGRNDQFVTGIYPTGYVERLDIPTSEPEPEPVLADDDDDDAAVAKIQAMQRGKVQRAELSKQHGAATRLQTLQRGKAARRKVRAVARTVNAVAAMQLPSSSSSSEEEADAPFMTSSSEEESQPEPEMEELFLTVGDLRKRAISFDIDEDVIEEARDADEPKAALSALISQAQAATGAAVTATVSQPDEAAGLSMLSVGELRVRAVALGFDEEEVEEARDAEDPKEALIALIAAAAFIGDL